MGTCWPWGDSPIARWLSRLHYQPIAWHSLGAYRAPRPPRDARAGRYEPKRAVCYFQPPPPKVPYFDVIFNEASWGAEQQTHGKLLSRATPGGLCFVMGSISVFPLSKCHLKIAIFLLFYGIPDCTRHVATHRPGCIGRTHLQAVECQTIQKTTPWKCGKRNTSKGAAVSVLF